MPLSAQPAHVEILAQEGGQSQGFDPFLLIMIAVFGLLIFFMFRRSKKAQKEQQKKRSSLTQGQQVMTGAGIFGTVVDVNQDENKVVLELSPGNTATVHIQAIGQIVDPVEPEDESTTDEASPDAGAEYRDAESQEGSDTTPSFNPEDPRGDSDQK